MSPLNYGKNDFSIHTYSTTYRYVALVIFKGTGVQISPLLYFSHQTLTDQCNDILLQPSIESWKKLNAPSTSTEVLAQYYIYVCNVDNFQRDRCSNLCPSLLFPSNHNWSMQWNSTAAIHLCKSAREQNKNKDVTFTALFWTWKCILSEFY